jgi:anti-anti-sigma factor
VREALMTATTCQPAGRTGAVPLVEFVITGELDWPSLPRVRQQLDAVVSLRPRHVVIDLAGCTMLDAAAIALLLDVHRELRRAEGRLDLRRPTPRVRRILELARTTRVLPVIQ